MKRFWAALGFMGWAAAPVHAETCQTLTFNGTGYTICHVDLTQDRLELFLYDPEGKPHGYFNTLNTALKKQGQQLGFAMNAGMYHDDRAPVGYYLENGKEHQKVISSDGPGNFGLLPNGVLCLRDGRDKSFFAKGPRLPQRHPVRAHAGDRRQAAPAFSERWHVALYS